MQNLSAAFAMLRSNNQKVDLMLQDGGRSGDRYIMLLGDDFIGLNAPLDKIDIYPLSAISCIAAVDQTLVNNELARMPLRSSR